MESIIYTTKYIHGYYCVVSLVDDKWKVHEIWFAKDEAEKRCDELNNVNEVIL